MKKLTVIIPCYNESENLKGGVLNEVSDYLSKKDFDWEVIVSDDQSTDESRELVKIFNSQNPKFKLLENHHGGKPFAIKAATEAAQGDYCVFTDMDQSIPISELEKIYPYFDRFEVVIGSRGTERKGSPWYRKLMSWVFGSFRKMIVLGNLADTQCGFKGYKTDVGIRIFEKMSIFQKRSKGWKVGAWDVEFLFVAEKMGYRTKEVPVLWRDRDVSRGKKKNFLKESKEMLTEIFRVRINDWQGKYE